MLSLNHIVKRYVTGDTTVTALKGITVDFRKSEFVSILGPSGCGKTTLLNIIGGFDRYDEGDLQIKGKSTKLFHDRDWDSYRNHSVGFVFQSYNLIPHQTVLSNVELALTISGVSKNERRQRAIEALNRVGLGDQLRKKPNQMSGGQMQRVAIARALVNDPEILLADEPTGALDSVTSVQIMEILKEISHDKLIIMVTHNPELAHQYSSRIIRLSDGMILDDSNPYTESEEEKQVVADIQSTTKKESRKEKRKNRTSMSFWTALSLSKNNLLTKKARTFMVSFAGSIGIIGIALILALSNGIQLYINKVQEDTLSSYPITIQSQTIDYTSLMESYMGQSSQTNEHDLDQVYSNNIMFQMMSVITSEIQTNNLAAFKSYLDSQEEELRQNTINDIQYGYDLDLTIYSSDTENGVTKLGLDFLYSMIYGSNFSSMTTSLSMGSSVFSEMIDNPELIASQYDVIAGRIASNYDEVVLVVDQNNELSDMVLYALGLKDQSELLEIMTAYMNGQVPDSLSTTSYSYDDLLNTTFKLVLPSDFYEKEEDGNWSYIGNKTESLKEIVDNGLELKIVGILRPSEDAVSSSVSGAVAYTSDLVEYIIQQTNNSQLVKEQMENPTVDILTGLPFPTEDQAELSVSEKVAAITTYLNSLSSMEQAAIFQSIYTTPSEEQIEQAVNAYWSSVSDSSVLLSQLMERYAEESGLDAETIAAYFSTLSEEEVNTILQQMVRESVSQQLTEQLENEFNQLTAGQLTTLFEAYLSALDDSELEQLYDVYMPAAYSDSSYEENLALFGSLDLDNPSSISIYAKDFDSKEKIAKLISDYNDSVEEQDQITYTDYVGLLMSSVSTIVNFVSYALIAFVSISLVVSSIMIGIITYISVLERTKEIGILRAIGASKKDISRVFNAETLIIGLAAGIIGIGISLLLCIPINLIIGYLADVHSIASMPVGGAVALILLSVFLTIIAGLIPSRIAAKKDPVIALRSE